MVISKSLGKASFFKTIIEIFLQVVNYDIMKTFY